jgi:hypothetical protein
MKGTIAKCLEELVKTKFGKDKWEKILEKSGVPTGAVFLPISDIDDAVVMKVVQNTCGVLGISLDAAADAFGDFWMNSYAPKFYSSILTKHKTAKDFLLDMDNVHIHMTNLMKNAHPPRFTYSWKDDKTLLMKYQSKRGLIVFMIGLVKGVGKYFKENLKVRKLSETELEIVFA